MSFFKKVMSTVSNLVQTNIKGFDVEKDPISQGGVQGQWKIHNAIKSDKSKTPGSAFIFQKGSLKDSDESLAIYKREATSIARLRHPAILSIQEPLYEEKTFLAFVTERVECSLATALQRPEIFQEHCSSDIEMQMHLLEVVDAIMFLHNDARQVHLDINPNSIFITSNGKWKLASLAFSQQIVNKELVEAQQVDFSNKSRPNPQFNFASPELLNGVSKCNYQSDVFSFGMVILRMLKYRNDKISFPEFHSIDDYRKYIQRLPGEISQYSKYYPMSLLDFLSRMLSNNPNERPQINEFVHLDWFKDPLLQAFNILNKISELEQSQQIAFLKGLQLIIFAFDPALLRKRVFPVILELNRYDFLTPQVLKILIEAMKRDDIFDQNAYITSIWPKIKAITQGKEIPAQALYDLVSNIKVFHKYISIEELQQTLVPMMQKCYECKVPKLQDIALRVTPYLVQHSDYTFTKTKILPKILLLCCDPNVEVRKVALICLLKFIDVIDRSFLCDQVISTLDKVKQVGTDRAINQLILKIYQQIAQTLPVELIATKILTQITPFLMEVQLSRQEFDDYMTTLKSLLDRIQEERYKTLEITSSASFQLDLNLDIPEPKKYQNTGDQYDFLNQFVSQGRQMPQQQQQEQLQTPNPVVNPQVNDPFGFSSLLNQPQPQLQAQTQNTFNQTTQAKPNLTQTFQQKPQPQTQTQTSDPLSAFQFNSQPFSQTNNFSAFGSVSTNNQTPNPFNFSNPSSKDQSSDINNIDPWAQFNQDLGGKKLSQRPMWSKDPPSKQSPPSSNPVQQYPTFQQQSVTTQQFDSFKKTQPVNDPWSVQTPSQPKAQNQSKYDAFDLI